MSQVQDFLKIKKAEERVSRASKEATCNKETSNEKNPTQEKGREKIEDTEREMEYESPKEGNLFHLISGAYHVRVHTELSIFPLQSKERWS